IPLRLDDERREKHLLADRVAQRCLTLEKQRWLWPETLIRSYLKNSSEWSRELVQDYPFSAWGGHQIFCIEQTVGSSRQMGRPERPRGSPLYICSLRAEGLEEAEIDFWCSHDLTVQAVLGHAISKGVEVKALIWACPELFSHYHPKVAEKQLRQVGVTCILDDSSHGVIHHPIESLHQKIVVVDGTHAFVGGIDMLIELSGDFDRWDNHLHQLFSPLRRNDVDESPHPWHDAHAVIEGPAVGDVELNFRQRWNDVVQRHEWDNQLLVPEHPLPPPFKSKSQVQVPRRIPEYAHS